VILTAQGNILATYTSPLTQQGYLAKLSAVVAQFGGQGSKPAAVPGPRQVNAAYAGLQGNQMHATSTPLANPVAGASASNVTPATSAMAAAALNPQPASQPSQNVNRYALPTRQYNSSPKKPEVPVNAMPSSYRNPYMAQQMQTSPVQQTAAVAYPSQQPATASTVPPAVVSKTVREPGAGTLATKNSPKTSPDNAQLPAGSPPLGFDGYCPVTLKFDKKWVRGDVKYGAIHRGRTYLFVGEGQRQQFLANPDAYSPVFSGMDPVAFLDSKQTIEGSRRYGFEYRGAFYLFSSSETMQKFASQPDSYAVGVRQAMVQLDAGSGTIRR
jgi:protein disulfide-isomerase